MKILIDKNGDALNSYTRNKLHQGLGVLVDAEGDAHNHGCEGQ